MDIYATCIIAQGYPERYNAALLQLERNANGQLVWRKKEESLFGTCFEEELKDLEIRWYNKPSVHLGKIHRSNFRQDERFGYYFFYRDGDI